MKTMEDAERIYNLSGKSAVVIGAGSVGVEASISLTRRGMKVSLLEQLGHVLPTVFDEEAALIIRKRVEDLGVEVITGEKALKFTGEGRVTGVITDTRQLNCDLVVVAVGLSPDVELAKKGGGRSRLVGRGKGRQPNDDPCAGYLCCRGCCRNL